jgi:hypothetical protein
MPCSVNAVTLFENFRFGDVTNCDIPLDLVARRSAMFPAIVRKSGFRFARLERGGIFLELLRSINITSPRDGGTRAGKILPKKNKKLDFCITEIAQRGKCYSDRL